jgi:hypothetical protein
MRELKNLQAVLLALSRMTKLAPSKTELGPCDGPSLKSKDNSVVDRARMLKALTPSKHL